MRKMSTLHIKDCFPLSLSVIKTYDLFMFRKYIRYNKSVWIPGKIWSTVPTLSYFGFCLISFSDLAIILQMGTFIEQALLCSRHCTKWFISSFSNVVHGSTSSALIGNSVPNPDLQHQNLHCKKLSMLHCVLQFGNYNAFTFYF